MEQFISFFNICEAALLFVVEVRRLLTFIATLRTGGVKAAGGKALFYT